MTKHYCDKCGKEAKLSTVKITVSRDYMGEANIEICSGCLEQLGIVKTDSYDHGKVNEIPFRNNSDKVYELIKNIVSDVLSQ